MLTFATQEQINILCGYSTDELSAMEVHTMIIIYQWEDIDEAPDLDSNRIRHANTSNSRTNGVRSTKTEFVSSNEPINYRDLKSEWIDGQICLPDDFPSNPQPYDFFQLYMTDSMIFQIKQATNRSVWDHVHCQQSQNLESTDPISMHLDDENLIVKQTTMSDIKCFLGIQLYQGLADLKHERMYFHNYLIYLEPPMKSFMDYDTFLFIKRHFLFR